MTGEGSKKRAGCPAPLVDAQAGRRGERKAAPSGKTSILFEFAGLV